MSVLPPVRFLKTLHVSPRLGAVYVNNPKVACSTIKLALQRAEMRDPAWTPPTSVHDHAASPLLTWPDLTMATWQDALAGRFVFSFVRNPYARLRSAYLNRIVQPQKKGIHRLRAGFAHDEVPAFPRFVAAVCDTDPQEHDAHWRPQALNLAVGRIRLDFLGRLERFGADWSRLSDRLGLPETPERAGKVTGPDRQADLSFTPEMRRQMRRAYGTDFEAFRYDPDIVP